MLVLGAKLVHGENHQMCTPSFKKRNAAANIGTQDLKVKKE